MLRTLAIILLCLPAGCGTLDYYSQSIAGGVHLLEQRTPVSAVIADPKTPDHVRSKLQVVARILDFAHTELGLPDNGSYDTYADTGRQYVVWNVFVAPPLSVQPVQSCFLFVGCLAYRGFFDRERALKYSDKMARAGMDVYLGGVSAYSTLGWFADPVLNTMIDRPDYDIARVIFHELSHQKLYFRNDTDFNEAFADAVAFIGVNRWLRSQHAAALERFNDENLQEARFTNLVLSYRQRLKTLYASAAGNGEKLARKQQLMDEMLRDYHRMREQGLLDAGYDQFMSAGVNNARLASIATYRELVPGFLRVYALAGDDLQSFYARVAALQRCSMQARRQTLEQSDGTLTCAGSG